MDIKTIINSLGIIFTIWGVLMVYLHSPLNISSIHGGYADTDWDKIEAEVNRHNKLMKYGVIIVIAGSLLQLISNFIPTGEPLFQI
ncbi:hypothetical protein [Pontibacter pamirensis]|uniref:hypothetical protein n=1 Tax=Pontibacter pamirensis TaxID=2562824 RepID=UPI0013895254|nr:hypothetical protein [Pontibacter pamirensis]